MEEYVDKAKISMRPELRERIRDVSDEAFMPGIPREARLQIQIAQAQAEAQASAAGAGGGGQPSGSPQVAGDSPAEGAGDGIAGSPDQRSL